jgi:hypothetical protein
MPVIIHEFLIDSCIKAGSVFPQRKKKKKIPYWGLKLKPLKDNAIFWKNLWQECGKPSSGIIHELMRKTKLEFHYGVRKIKRDSEVL